MTAEYVRYHLTVPKELSTQLEALAGKGKPSKSAILAAALGAFLDRRAASGLDEQFAMRLDRMSYQLARIQRDCGIELETLALFIRYMLTVNAPLPEADEALRAIGRDRFAVFVERVGRQIASGKRSFDPEAASGERNDS